MKTGVLLLLLLLCLSATRAQAQQLAFPTAEGYGRFAQGGRGGKAYHINSLAVTAGTGGSCNAGGCGGSAPFSAGTITFRDCLFDRFGVGPRTCIFRLGGIIDWFCNEGIGTDCPAPNYPNFLTIAGQTAPGDGIVLKSFDFTMYRIDHVIIRHLRSRLGVSAPGTGQAGVFAAVGTSTAPFDPSSDVIVDHCSFAWAQDDTAGTLQARNFTIQWTIIAEALGNPPTPPSDPGKCGLFSNYDDTYGSSSLHNYMASVWYRCPQVNGGRVQLINNLWYNTSAALMVRPTYGAAHVEARSNYAHPGPFSAAGNNTRVGTYGYGDDPELNDPAKTTNSALYMTGNIHSVYKPIATSGLETDWISPQRGTILIPLSGTPLGLDFPTIPSQTVASQVPADIMAKVGARVPKLDSVDQRQLDDWLNCADADGSSCTGRSGYMGNESVVGGYPVYTSGSGPYTDTDGDGISDSWETAHGLNPNDPADGPLIHTNGYSNLENFLNELAGDTVPGLGGGAAPTNLRVIR